MTLILRVVDLIKDIIQRVTMQSRTPPPFCTQNAFGWWSKILPDSAAQGNTLEEQEKRDSAADILKVPHKDGDKRRGVTVSVGEVDPALCRVASGNSTAHRFNKNKNIIPTKRSNSDHGVLEGGDQKVEDGAKQLQLSGSSEEKDQQETAKMVDDEELQPSGTKLLTSVRSKQQETMESCNSQIKQESDPKSDAAETSWSYEYFTRKLGKLSEVYKDAGKRLQDTQDIIRNVGVTEMKVVLFQYVTKMSKELPLFQRLQPKLEPEPCVPAGDKVSLIDLSKDGNFSLRQSSNSSGIPGISKWPEGSVSSVKNASPAVFCQRLVQLPPALSKLQSLPPQEVLEKLGSLGPQMEVDKLLSVFWLNAASRKQPVPTPVCLLLFQEEIIVLSSKTRSNDTLTAGHRFKLPEIKEVQIGLAGQHVRLISCCGDAILAVFTHSKGLTQEFCKALLKVLLPHQDSEEVQGHPLLSGDLTALSLDWTSCVPDVVLAGGLRVTSRLKRVLADLLYIVHGNMDGPGKPSLADVRPLLYTSVKVMNSARVHSDDILQFLLTDTHVALLREDGVFHPAPRGSSLVPAQPQFQGLELRRRSDIRCLFVKQSDGWPVVDIAFATQQPQTRKKPPQSRRGSVDLPSASHVSRQGESWKLSFGCSSEAAVLIKHLCI